MPAHCGTQGPMLCLYGSVCNDTLGVCVDCPAGFRDDTTFFKGNQNCGLNVAGLVVVYFLTTLFALLVGVSALRTALAKKRSKMRSLLFLVATWNFIIPFMLLSHYLEGFQYGPVAMFLNVLILMLVNTQVSVYLHTKDLFMDLLLHYSTPEKIHRDHLLWYCFWMAQKLVFGLLAFISAIIDDDGLFNIAQVCLGVSITIEVVANIARGFMTSSKTLKAIEVVRTKIESAQMSPVVTEFAERTAKTRWIMPVYGITFIFAGIALPILFVIFDSSVPYVFVFFDFMMLTWPAVGMIPVAVMKTKLGVQMDRGKESSTLHSDDRSFNRVEATKAAPPKVLNHNNEKDATVGSYEGAY